MCVLTYTQRTFTLSDINGNVLQSFGLDPFPGEATVAAMSPDSLLVCYGSFFTSMYYINCISRTSIDALFDNFIFSKGLPGDRSSAFSGEIVISEDKLTIAFYTLDDYTVKWISLTPGDKYSGELIDPMFAIDTSISGFSISDKGKYIGFALSDQLVIFDTETRVYTEARSNNAGFAMTTLE